VIPSVLWVCSHLPTYLLEGLTIGMEFIQKLSVPIVTSLNLSIYMLWNWLTKVLIHEAYIVNVVIVVHEAPHLLRYFRFSLLDHSMNELLNLLISPLLLKCDALEQSYYLIKSFFCHSSSSDRRFFLRRIPVRLSA